MNGDFWPTVLILGPTGAGKTSLLRALFGNDLVPDSRVGHGQPVTHDFDRYESAGLRIYDSRGSEPAEYDSYRRVVEGFLKAQVVTSDLDQHVHVVWHVISGPGARVTEADLRSIREISPHFLVAITKSDITRPDQLADLIKTLVEAGVPRSSIVPCSVDSGNDSTSMLLAKTTALFGASHGDVIAAATRRQRAATVAASSIVSSAVSAAAFTGMIPIGSARRVQRIERKMVEQIAERFGASHHVAGFWHTVGDHGDDVWWAALSLGLAPWILPFASLVGITAAVRVTGTGAAAIAYFSSGQNLSKRTWQEWLSGRWHRLCPC